MVKHQESTQQFEKRKQEHIELALSSANEAIGGSGLEAIQLPHQAIPDIDFDTVDISARRFNQTAPNPFFISSMTAGHQGATDINYNLAAACNETGWAMGVGSQRRQLFDPQQANEWVKFKPFTKVDFFGNIGITQLVDTPIDALRSLVDSLNAKALIVHTNPLQECIQTEGTPKFQGCWQALEALCKTLERPVIVKETGCGFSQATLQRLNDCGVSVVDVSGFGGTHWGRIEGQRSHQALRQRAASTFANWGISTVESIINAKRLTPRSFEIWGSGGLRNGLDAAKVLAIGAQSVGFAKPMLEAAIVGIDQTIALMNTIAFELKIALFCSGADSIHSLQEIMHGPE